MVTSSWLVICVYTLRPCSNIFKPFQWELERLYNGRYKIKARDAPTGERNNLLYAYLIEPERAEEWIITKRGDDGHRNLYTLVTLYICCKRILERHICRSIQKADGQDGWVKQTNVEDPQVTKLLVLIPQAEDFHVRLRSVA
jgi:hypothetical protein